MLPPFASRPLGLITIDELTDRSEIDDGQACDDTLGGILIALLHGRCTAQRERAQIGVRLPIGRFAGLIRPACEPLPPVIAVISSLTAQLELALVEARERIALAERAVG
jgi:hypothetical protein